jgi:CrcB protein
MTEPQSTLARLEAVALVAAGGFAGANLRHLVAGVLPGIPGTLFANILGSLALGFLVSEAVAAGSVGRRTRLVVSTGLLSSFTTYSTFALQSVEAALPLLVANVVATYTLGFAAALAGRSLARRVGGGR